MPTNDFKPFAVGGSAAVVSQASYAANAALLANGFQVGVADPAYLNKVWRQSSIISAAVAQLIADTTAANVVDDGTTATIEANLIAAVKTLAAGATFATRPYGDNSGYGASTQYVDRAVAQVGGYYQDAGGTANAYVVAMIPAVTAYDHAISFRFRTTRANSGAATINFGAGAVALKSETGGALAAGDISTGSIVSVTYDPGLAYAVVNELVPSQLGTLARENIGQGLEDDGAGSLRVKLADSSVRRSASGIQNAMPLTAIAANTTIGTGHQGNALRVTAAGVVLTAPLTSTLWNGYAVNVRAENGPVTFTPNAADKVNNGTAGASFTILGGQSVEMVTDGAGNWWPMFPTTPLGAFAPLYITSAQTLGAGTYQADTTAGAFTVTLPSGAAAGTTLEFSDPFGSWTVNPLTIAGNGATILGSTTSLVCDVGGETFRIIYNGTDWRLF